MNAKTKSIFLAIFSCVPMAVQVTSAATIPSGTMITVRTTNTISSRDLAGKQFQGRVAESVETKGGLALPAGAVVMGVVQSPRVVIGSNVRPLTLTLTKVSVNGRTVSVMTQPYEAASPSVKGRRHAFTGDAFLLPPGTILQFRLSQALKL